MPSQQLNVTKATANCRYFPTFLKVQLRTCHDRRPKQLLEGTPQRLVDFVHRRTHAKVRQARDPIMRLADATGDDSGKMRQVRRDVYRDAMQADPALQPNAE